MKKLRVYLILVFLFLSFFSGFFLEIEPVKADTVTYYFDSYDSGGEEWEYDPGYMVDGSLSSFAKTRTVGDVELLTGNSYSGGGSG
ncbi:MAG: hypothetical protein V5A64_02440, partial [Candidatus Thermoplasmatota archaeon]